MELLGAKIASSYRGFDLLPPTWSTKNNRSDFLSAEQVHIQVCPQTKYINWLN